MAKDAIFSLEHTNRIFRDSAIAAWKIQPVTGNIPAGLGPIPIDKYWSQQSLHGPSSGNAKNDWFNYFMSITLLFYYSNSIPDWAVQKFDLMVEIEDSNGKTFTKERKGYITTFISGVN
jgi:hypothetical protein